MENKIFNPADSLKTIEEAINETRKVKTGASFYYILWGAVLFVYFALPLLSIVIPNLKGSIIDSFNWLIFPIGGLLSALNKNKDKRKETNIPHFEKIYFFAFTGFAMTYGITTLATMYLFPKLSIILFPVLIGATVYSVGGITKHQPSIVGGVVGMALSGISIFSNLEVQFLCAALAAISSCFIPGLLMKNRNV